VQRTMRPRMLFFRGWNRGALRRAVGRAGRAAVAITRVETFLFMGASYSLAGGCRTGSPLSTSCELHYNSGALRFNQEMHLRGSAPLSMEGRRLGLPLTRLAL